MPMAKNTSRTIEELCSPANVEMAGAESSNVQGEERGTGLPAEHRSVEAAI
jgi:hypothetical protein